MGAEQNLDVFATLAEAVGLTRDGELQGQWFQDPLGTPNGSKRGLSSMMYLEDQREALITFVDDVLGTAERDTEGDAIWVPLFKDSGATIFLVVQQASDGVRVGFGIEYESGSETPSVAVRAHVPVFQFEREGAGPLDTSGSEPDWLVLGRALTSKFPWKLVSPTTHRPRANCSSVVCTWRFTFQPILPVTWLSVLV